MNQAEGRATASAIGRVGRCHEPFFVAIIRIMFTKAQLLEWFSNAPEEAAALEAASKGDVLRRLAADTRVAKCGGARGLVILKAASVELLVNALIDARCKHSKQITDNSRDFPLSVKLILLHELGITSDKQHRLLDLFRRLRNRAAHDALFEVSDADLQPFWDELQEKVTLERLCSRVFEEAWQIDAMLFCSRFAPGAEAWVLSMVPRAVQAIMQRRDMSGDAGADPGIHADSPSRT
jgi:hypothetical protein